MLSKDGSRTYPIRKQGRNRKANGRKSFIHKRRCAKRVCPCSDETEDKKPEMRESSIFGNMRLLGQKKKQ
ncbi:MAG: hypothetical protein ACLVAU_10900 [Ruminococcus sp.]